MSSRSNDQGRAYEYITLVTLHTEISKTPESELMSVDEYFDMVWNRYMEKYEELHR